MTVTQQTFESGSNGTTVSSANTAGGGTPVSISVGTGGTVVFSSSSPIDGSLSAAWSAPSGISARVQFPLPDVRGVGTFAKHYLSATATDFAFHGVRNATTRMATVALLASGKVKLSSSNADLYTTPNAITLPGTYWVDVAADGGTGTGDGKIRFAIFDSAGAFAGGMTDYVEFTARNTGGGANAAALWLGATAAEAVARSGKVDTIRALDAYGSAFPATATQNPPAAVNAATGWTPTGGTVLAVLSDNDAATLITSTDNPTALLLDLQAPRLVAPAGDFTVAVDAQRVSSSTGKIVGKLYDGTTLRATSADVGLSGSMATVNVVFPAASITAVTGWASGVRVTLEATAA